MKKPDTTTMERPASTDDVGRPMDEAAKQVQQQPDEAHSNAPLLTNEIAQRLQEEWTDVQASFVDEPRQAVQRADELVAYASKQIAETFARERSRLEAQWDREGEVSTEDLRVALTRYRSFFHRLLSM
jgi:anaerobic selenocysteine-containing dehydrogenase